MKKSKSLASKHKKHHDQLIVPETKILNKRSKSQAEPIVIDDDNLKLIKDSKYLRKEIIELFPDNKRFVIGQWVNIEKMRTEAIAAVDTMGVTMCGDKTLSAEEYQYQTLVSLVVSASTNDKITFPTIGRLQEYGLSLNNIEETDEEVLDDLIKNINYHKNKTKYIKGLTSMIINKFGGKPPSTIGDVMKLPGIGPKMGNLYMQVCFNQNTGIAVDTHVHRIANKLKWVDNCKTPEKTMKELESWLPISLWDSINNLLVGFGQSLCKKVKPLCENCLLNKECDFGILFLESKAQNKKTTKRKAPNDNDKASKKTRSKISLALED